MKARTTFWELTGYRLPTEAEWEFACRAGANTSRYYGRSETVSCLSTLGISPRRNHAWPVASLKPNDFGLFDMQGNALEWCSDVYRGYPSATPEAFNDAPGDEAVSEPVSRVVRGGAFNSQPAFVRSASRYYNSPANRSHYIGFRPARTYSLRP